MSMPCPQCRGSIGSGLTGPESGRCPICGSEFAPGPMPDAFGAYRVSGIIGRGGMGIVYRAVHEVTGEEVAVKTVSVRKHLLLRRIRREVAALARIRHPGLVRIIETGLSDGLPWYAMELLRGTTLHAYLHRDFLKGPGELDAQATRVDFVVVAPDTPIEGRPPADDAGSTASIARGSTAVVRPEAGEHTPTSFEHGPDAESEAEAPPRRSSSLPGPGLVGLPEEERSKFLVLIAQLCGTLAHLHGEGIVHRDLKPRNVFLRPDGTPVLLDLGLASYFGASGRESLEVGGRVEGTPEYMSPEQARGEFVDARADLYAIGCLLYQGVTGRVPFRSATANGTLRAHVKVPPTPPRELVPDCPEALDALILGLLAKKASDRLGYANDVVSALARMGTVVPDWEVARPPRDYLYRPGFVGRGAVLTELETHVRRSISVPGHAIFLTGHSGSGKTRVIMELARILELGGMTVVTCECQPVGIGLGPGDEDGPGVAATPLHPFRPLLQVMADACVERGGDVAGRVFGDRGRILAECEPALRSLPGLGVDGPEVADRSGDVLGSRLVEALGEALSEFAADSPVVILVDDLQWADELSLLFLAMCHMGAWDRPNVAVVAAYRIEEEAEAFRGLRKVFQDASFVEVGPLQEDCIREIVRGMLGSHEPDDRFVGHLARRSRGSPFFVAEYLRSAVAEGILYRNEAGAWMLQAPADGDDLEARYASIPLPDSLHALVARRLDRLSPDAGRLLELAAVLGREVEPALIDAVGLLGDAETLAAAEALLVAQVLEEAPDGRFRFAHDKILEIAYEKVPIDRRRSLHRSVALAMERLEAGRDDPRAYPSLAHHWYRSIGNRASDPLAVSRAVEYLEKSLAHAVSGGLAGEAVDFGRAAARLLGVFLPDEPIEVARSLADEMGRIDRALGDRPPLDLLNLHATADPGVARITGILLAIQAPAFLSNQLDLFALMASKNLSMTIDRGLGAHAPAVFGMFAIATRIIRDDPRRAAEFSTLAIELDRRAGGRFTADVRFFDAWFIRPWVAPIRECLEGCRQGAEAGLSGGSSLYGCFNLAAEVVLLAAAGEPLSSVIALAETALTRIGRKARIARFHTLLERQFALALAGRTASPTSLSDAHFHEDRDLAFIRRTSNANQLGFYHVARLKLHYFAGRYLEARQAAEAAMQVRQSFARQPAEVDLAFYRAMTLLALGDAEGAREHRDALNRWRRDAEFHFGPMASLVEAEFARLEGRDPLPLCRIAAQAESTPLAAIAAELASRALAHRGDLPAAQAAQSEAVALYRAWGASTVADRLEPT